MMVVQEVRVRPRQGDARKASLSSRAEQELAGVAGLSLALARRLSTMEAGVLRVVVLVALFLLLTADYSALVSQLLHAFGEPPTSTPPPTPPPPTLGDDTWQAMTTTTRKKLVSTIKNTCLPKLICELNAAPMKERLTDSEKALLGLIRDTSMGVTGEVTSKYHFAAHMGQLIAGVDGAGCHNFYPGCPFPGLTAISLVKSSAHKNHLL